MIQTELSARSEISPRAPPSRASHRSARAVPEKPETRLQGKREPARQGATADWPPDLSANSEPTASCDSLCPGATSTLPRCLRPARTSAGTLTYSTLQANACQVRHPKSARTSPPVFSRGMASTETLLPEVITPCHLYPLPTQGFRSCCQTVFASETRSSPAAQRRKRVPINSAHSTRR